MSSIFAILKLILKLAYLKFSVSGRSKQASKHRYTRVLNEVTLVWGSLRLAPNTDTIESLVLPTHEPISRSSGGQAFIIRCVSLVLQVAQQSSRLCLYIYNCVNINTIHEYGILYHVILTQCCCMTVVSHV